MNCQFVIAAVTHHRSIYRSMMMMIINNYHCNCMPQRHFNHFPSSTAALVIGQP